MGAQLAAELGSAVSLTGGVWRSTESRRSNARDLHTGPDHLSDRHSPGSNRYPDTHLGRSLPGRMAKASREHLLWRPGTVHFFGRSYRQQEGCWPEWGP